METNEGYDHMRAYLGETIVQFKSMAYHAVHGHGSNVEVRNVRAR